jgi:hypothetical protein
MTVRERVIAATTEGGHELSARRLFILFCAHARKSYKYNAVALKESGGHTLLDRPENEIVTVDCAALALAFSDLLNDLLKDENAEVKEVGYADNFATQQGSRCFDSTIVGNIRKPTESWSATSRCVFKNHFFVETGSQTRMYYDPCMFTTYSTMDDVMTWKFQHSGGRFLNMVMRVIGSPEHLLIRVPHDHFADKPPGFNIRHILFKTSDMKKNELSTLWGRRNKPAGWSDSKFATNEGAALTRINKLLREQAGVNTPWAFA